MYSLALIIFVVSEKKAFEHFPIGSNVNGGHLGFPIGIKNRNMVKDIPMIILYSLGSVSSLVSEKKIFEISGKIFKCLLLRNYKYD
jgi:hypothetical protein